MFGFVCNEAAAAASASPWLCTYPHSLHRPCVRGQGRLTTQTGILVAAAGDVLGVLLYLDAHPHQLHNRTIFQSEVCALYF